MFIKELTISYNKKRILKSDYSCIGKSASSSGTIYRIFKNLWKECVEKFYVLHCNNDNAIQSYQLIAIGSLSKTIIHPREVYKGALLSDSASVAFVHNHTSGNPKPSAEDILMTQRLEKAAEIMGIDILDHIIVGNTGYTSFRAIGLLKNKYEY